MNASASPFRTRTALVLIAVGLAAMLGFLLVNAYGGLFERQRGNTPSPVSRYGTGFHALFRLVELSGGAPRLVRHAEFDDDAALLVLIPNMGTSRTEIEDAVAGREGPTLIILPKWIAARSRQRPDREERIAMLPARPLADMLGGMDVTGLVRQEPGALGTNRGMGLRPFPAGKDKVQAIVGDRLAALIDGPQQGAVLAEVKGRNIYILADPDLVSNHGLADRGNARAAIAMLAALNPDHPSQVAFDTMLPFGAGGRNVTQLMFEPPFAGITLALFAAALMAGLATLVRFGPVRREPRAIPFGKTALIENIVSLTRSARRTHEGGAAYADAIRAWMARRLALPRGLTGAALDAHLGAIRTDTPYAPWRERLTGAQSDAELLAAARKLDDWRKEAIS